MGELEVLENTGTAAVRRLRDSKLSAGKPFMINSDELPFGKCGCTASGHNLGDGVGFWKI